MEVIIRIYEIHIFELRMKELLSERSLQLWYVVVTTQLKQLQTESLRKKIKLERDSNPSPLRLTGAALCQLSYQAN